MSWIKIPCLVYACLGLQVAVTPPHPPPPPREELFASTPFEPLLKQRVGPIVVKYLCWIVTLVEIVVIIVAKYLPDWRYSALIISVLSYNGHVEAIRISPMFIFGISLTLLGASLRAWCYRELGTLFTFEVCIRDDHRLIQTGPYRLVRHPGYAGALLTVAGVVCWNASPGSWWRESGALQTRIGISVAFTGALLVMSITVGLLMRMSKEDEALKNWFGEDWNRWRNTVPYKLVPGIF